MYLLRFEKLGVKMLWALLSKLRKQEKFDLIDAQAVEVPIFKNCFYNSIFPDPDPMATDMDEKIE